MKALPSQSSRHSTKAITCSFGHVWSPPFSPFLSNSIVCGFKFNKIHKTKKISVFKWWVLAANLSFYSQCGFVIRLACAISYSLLPLLLLLCVCLWFIFRLPRQSQSVRSFVRLLFCDYKCFLYLLLFDIQLYNSFPHLINCNKGNIEIHSSGLFAELWWCFKMRV